VDADPDGLGACSMPVVSGIDEITPGPAPIFVHSCRTLWVISSTANVAIPADRPESRISATPATKAYTAPIAVASANDETLPTAWSRRRGNASGSVPVFESTGALMIPAAYAPTAAKLSWAKDTTPELPTKTYSATTIATETRADSK
jgi:hypothetical protein